MRSPIVATLAIIIGLFALSTTGLAGDPSAAKQAPPAAPAAFRQALGHVAETYLTLQEALAGDNFQAAHDAIQPMIDAIRAVDAAPLSRDGRAAWQRTLDALGQALDPASRARNVAGIRAPFAPLSTALIEAVRAFGFSGPELHLMHCSMALNGRGADWLQRTAQVRNPYFGSSMLGCGEEREVLRPSEAPADNPHQGHSH